MRDDGVEMKARISNHQRQALIWVLREAILHGRFQTRQSLKSSKFEQSAVSKQMFFLFDAIHDIPDILNGLKELDEQSLLESAFRTYDEEWGRQSRPRISLESLYRTGKEVAARPGENHVDGN